MAAASAKSKQPEYSSTADASAGLDVLGLADGSSLVAVGETASHSDTDRAGAGSMASASALRVLGNQVGGTADCESSGATGHGVQRDQDQGGPLAAEEQLTIGLAPAPVSVTLLSASCESRAVQENNASSSAEASVLEADAGEIDIVVLGSSSSTKTTSGQAGSGQTESAFTVASVGDTTILGCSSRSKTTNGGAEDASSVTVLGQSRDGECPLTSADTTHERTAGR